VPSTKPVLEMTNAEWRDELARINREGFAARTRSQAQAATDMAYANIRRRNPQWTPTPIEIPEQLGDLEASPEELDETLAELRRLQQQDNGGRIDHHRAAVPSLAVHVKSGRR
jgi:hypothetical protein